MKLKIGDLIKMKKENFVCQILQSYDDSYFVKHRDKNIPNFTVWLDEIDKKTTKKLNLKVITDMSQSVVSEEYKAVITEDTIFIKTNNINIAETAIVVICLKEITEKELNKILKIFGFIYKGA